MKVARDGKLRNHVAARFVDVLSQWREQHFQFENLQRRPAKSCEYGNKFICKTLHLLKITSYGVRDVKPLRPT